MKESELIRVEGMKKRKEKSRQRPKPKLVVIKKKKSIKKVIESMILDIIE